MRILQVHNYHVRRGGSEVLFETLVALLRREGHQVTTYAQHNADIRSLADKFRALRRSLYSRDAELNVREIIVREHPDVVHVHNLYSLISPSVLVACRELDVPVVASVHDYQMVCPTAQHFRRGRPCELCLGGREYWCALTNCRGNLLMSMAYAVRTAVARKRRHFLDHISLFLPPSRFVAQQLAKAGFPADRIRVVPNPGHAIPAAEENDAAGDYAAYVGRISPEKGLDVLLEAVRQTGIPLRVAGDVSALPSLVRQAPPQVTFVGSLDSRQLPAFYRGARFLVVPSVWYEVFGMVAAEAMAYGRPAIVSRIGGLQEVVEDEVTGLHVRPRDAQDLARQMRRLWDDPGLCRELGRAARAQAVEEYSLETYYERICNVYQEAIEEHRPSRCRPEPCEPALV